MSNANWKNSKKLVGGAVEKRRRMHATNTGEFLGNGGSAWDLP